MTINGFLKKTSVVLNNLNRQFEADTIVPREAATHDIQNVNTTCKDNDLTDTVIIIDVSVSMEDDDYEPTRIDGGIEAGIEYTNSRADKHPSDRIAVVSFSDNGRIVLGLTDLNHKKKIISAIKGLEIEGGTDITAGLEKALRIFSKDQQMGRFRRIILLTDGHGGRPVRVAEKLKQQHNVLIDVIGIGGSRNAVNEKLLRKVATTDPNGFNHYHFIKNSKTLRNHYQQLATGLVWRAGKK